MITTKQEGGGRRWPDPRLMALLGLGALCLTMRAHAQSSVAAPTMGQVKQVVTGGPAGAKAAPVDPVAAAADRVGALRKKVLKDDDFIESEDNRDPFRSYLKLFGVTNTRAQTTGGPPKPLGIFDKFALEELTLIAIISGDENPRAMFRDPSGLGQTIKRGDYISKNSARVTKILSDRVIVELTEDTGGPDGHRVLEKAILVNPEEAQP